MAVGAEKCAFTILIFTKENPNVSIGLTCIMFKIAINEWWIRLKSTKLITCEKILYAEQVNLSFEI